MSDNQKIDIIESVFSNYGYPRDFLNDYDQMECLASRRGCETFLVKEKGSDRIAVAKCFDLTCYDLEPDNAVRRKFDTDRIPAYINEYRNEKYHCIVREYIEGIPLGEYVKENELTRTEITDICISLCDVIIYLHSQEPPVIHRDIKPDNVIIRPDGSVCLIDLDIARTFKEGSESDTIFLGTRGYAPPEQYGFAQTDERADIYSFGVLLRYLLTGNIKENRNVTVFKPLQRIIDRCTAFAPEKRFSDMKQVRKALLASQPKARFKRSLILAAAAAAVCIICVFAGIKIYRAVTYSPFAEGVSPAYLDNAGQTAAGVEYMKEKFNTDMFDEADEVACIGDLRAVLIELYGFEEDYVYGINEDMPQENDAYYLPWGWDDAQTVDRDICVYAALKAYDPALVADWSSLKDDNGFYPGVRVAMAFAEKNGILEGANRPGDITLGEIAVIFANTDKLFSKGADK